MKKILRAHYTSDLEQFVGQNPFYFAVMHFFSADIFYFRSDTDIFRILCPYKSGLNCRYLGLQIRICRERI